MEASFRCRNKCTLANDIQLPADPIEKHKKVNADEVRKNANDLGLFTRLGMK